MAYSKPMVLVYQEYAVTTGTAATAELPACIIGPCYHIVYPTEELAFAGEYMPTEGFSGLFPNNQPGAKIEADSVTILLKDAMVVIADNQAITEVSANSLKMTKGIPADVKIGDFVYLNDSVAEYRILDIDSKARTILLNRSALTGKTSCKIERKVEEIELPGTYTGVTLDVSAESISMIGLKVEVDGKQYTLDKASVNVGYKALRQDVSSLITIETENEIEGKLGKIVPENPLAFGVNVCLANTTTSVKCIGVDSDDLAGYTEAKDKIELVDPLYAIVPLTFSTEILTMFKNHAVQMSEPENGRWRVAIGCCKLQTTKTLAEGYGKVSADSNGAVVMFTATGGKTSVATGEEESVEFMSSDVDSGDTLIIRYNEKEYKYTIATVVAEDILTVTPGTPFDSGLKGKQNLEFEIVHELDKAEQAEDVAAVSRGYGSSRYINVWPDICVIDEQELPGYYLCCAVAGGIAGLPSQYGFTRLSMSGIGAVKHANDYFSQDMLDTIADGGTFIFVQETEEAPPYVRHQLTTDRSTVEFQELSFVKNFDYVSYICRDAMDQFIGKYNVTNSTIASIRSSLSAVLESIKMDVQAKIGAPITDYSIGSVAQLETDRTRIEAMVNVSFPYPLNTIGLHLISQ